MLLALTPARIVGATEEFWPHPRNAWRIDPAAGWVPRITCDPWKTVREPASLLTSPAIDRRGASRLRST